MRILYSNVRKKIKKNKNGSIFGGNEEKKYFIENLSVLISAGIDIVTALESVKSDCKSRLMISAIERMKEEIGSGSPIWRVLEEEKILPVYAISLIKIGEESGKLAENLKIVAVQQQKDRKFRSKISSASIYPSLVFFLTISIGVGISWFILPKLSEVFKSLKLELPLITLGIMAFGDFLGQYGLFAVPAFVLITSFIVYFIFFFKKTKHWGQFFLFHLPIASRIIKEIELSRTGYLLGTLLNAGIPISEAMHSISETSNLKIYRDFYEFLREKIIEGISFQESILIYPKSEKLIPISAGNIIAAGEKSGKLPESFIKIGEIYEEKMDNTSKNLVVMLEPILLIIVWLGVVAVALAVILPIYSLIGNLNKESGPPQTQQNQNVSESQVNEESSGDSSQQENIQEENIQQENVEIIPAEEDVEINEETEEIRTEKKLEVLETEIGFLNVRQEPSLKSPIIKKVFSGETYSYFDENEEWLMIELPDGARGWVSRKYIKISEDAGKKETASEKVEQNPR